MQLAGTDALDQIMDEIALYGPFSDESIEFPEVDGLKQNAGIKPDWFYEAYLSPYNHSEFEAITEYIQNNQTFVSYPDASYAFLGIATIEMRHYDHLGEFIKALGGELHHYFDNSMVPINRTIDEAIDHAIGGEQNTIANYQKVLGLVMACPPSKSRNIAEQLITKLIRDEELHVQILNRLKSSKGYTLPKKVVLDKPTTVTLK